MTRTAIRHTLSAFAAVALVSAFAGSPTSAENRSPFMGTKGAVITSSAVSASQPKTPKGFATKNHGQNTARGLPPRRVRRPLE